MNNGNRGDPSQKNPFKKKRGEGYIPPSQMPSKDENLPKESLATYSLLNQQKADDEMNDALVPGTFGGDDKLPRKEDPFEDRQSSNSNSYYNKQTTYNKEGPSMSITGSDGMLSFNPSNLCKIPANTSISGKNEAPPMSFGGTMLQNIEENE